MIQVLPRPKSTGDRFAEAFANAGSAASQLIPQEIMGGRERQQLGSLIGEDVGNIRNPDFLKQVLSSGLETKKRQSEFAADKENYEKIKDAFGEKFADVWLATGQGERTALTKAALDARYRGIDLDQILSGEGGISAPSVQKEMGRNNVVKSPSGKDFTLPEIPEPPGQTPSENIKYKREIRSDNSPIYKENINKRKAIKDTSQHLSILESLNDKIPEGLARLALDKEGNIRPTALRFKAVPKEMERFSKTINDFLTSAKDMFGARVTNYDISQFKSRLPGLLNSKEGRKEIIKQMQIFSKIEENYRDALNKVYQHYGLSNIPQEEAERLAEEMVADEEERLRAQLLEIGNEPSESSAEGGRMSLEEIFG